MHGSMNIKGPNNFSFVYTVKPTAGLQLYGRGEYDEGLNLERYLEIRMTFCYHTKILED